MIKLAPCRYLNPVRLIKLQAMPSADAGTGLSSVLRKLLGFADDDAIESSMTSRPVGINRTNRLHRAGMQD
jgi:hypothetical protein